MPPRPRWARVFGRQCPRCVASVPVAPPVALISIFTFLSNQNRFRNPPTHGQNNPRIHPHDNPKRHSLICAYNAYNAYNASTCNIKTKCSLMLYGSVSRKARELEYVDMTKNTCTYLYIHIYVRHTHPYVLSGTTAGQPRNNSKKSAGQPQDNRGTTLRIARDSSSGRSPDASPTLQVQDT